MGSCAAEGHDEKNQGSDAQEDGKAAVFFANHGDNAES